MNYLKAVVAGTASAAVALVVVWLLSGVALSIRMSQRMAQGVELYDLGLPESSVWLFLAIAVLAAAGGFWAGFRFMARRQRGLSRT